jgi:protein phosphatase
VPTLTRPVAIARTHTGNIRSGNEDSFYSNDDLGLWLVADGMGGHDAGEVASAIVAKTIETGVKNEVPLSDAIQDSHHQVLEQAAKGEGAIGMGSTVVAMQQLDSEHCVIGWVGDSRAYLWTQTAENDGELEQLTTDHSYVQALIESGALKREDAMHHPDKNIITQCLGSQELAKVRVDEINHHWGYQQTVLLCSDGLTDEVPEDEIATILCHSTTSEEAASGLIEAALKAGGKDNISIVLVNAPEKVAQTTVDYRKIGLIASITGLVLVAALIGLTW